MRISKVRLRLLFAFPEEFLLPFLVHGAVGSGVLASVGARGCGSAPVWVLGRVFRARGSEGVNAVSFVFGHFAVAVG